MPLPLVPVGLIGAPQNLPVNMLNIEEPIRKPPPLEIGAARKRKAPEEEEEILPKELPPLVETLKHSEETKS